jgi:hypothetical protein
MPCSRHRSGTGTPPSACRKIARIWGSLNLLVFIKIYSIIMPRKFYFCTQSISGGITPPPPGGLWVPGGGSLRPGEKSQAKHNRRLAGHLAVKERKFLSKHAAPSPGTRPTKGIKVSDLSRYSAGANLAASPTMRWLRIRWIDNDAVRQSGTITQNRELSAFHSTKDLLKKRSISDSIAGQFVAAR